ncbi:MAG TPA: ATP-binding protein [Candidatus Dormibacteraeota bacterium]|nr:ATP-binding protein [Candidatus Dormibacteraeota bacterium]
MLIDVAVSVGAALLALAAKWALVRAGLELSYLPLVIPIAAGAWRGGVFGGVLAMAVAAVGDLWLFDRSMPLGPDSPGPIGLVTFLVVGTTISVLSELRLATLRAATSSREARERAQLEAGHAIDRLVGLEALLERLAPATTPDQVADIILGSAIPLVEAETGAVVVLTADRAHARALTPGDGSPRSSDLAVHESGPLADVLLLGRSFWEPLADPPLPRLLDAPDALVPLRGRGPVIGALALRFRPAGGVAASDRAFIEAVASQCGQALERALMFEAERHLRRETETSREEAVRLRDELQAVLQSIGEPILVAGPSGEVTLANRAAEQLLGPVGRLEELRDRLHPESGDSLGLEPGRTTEARVAGSDRVVRLTVFDVRGRPSGSRVIALRDVTDARHAEQAREVFIGILSHELRTPVTTILGGIDLLARRLADDDRRTVMDDVRAESERLRRLVEDVLVLSRLERDALQVEDEPVLVHHLLAAIATEEARRSDPEADIRVELGRELAPVRADGTYLEQILRNLVGNAVKYGAGYGPIHVTAALRGETVDVVVADRGPGFPDDDAERLFELFYRSSRTSSKPGAGIGLFVARQLARSMGGELTARPRPGGGAEFILSLRALAGPDEVAVPRGAPREVGAAGGSRLV